MKTLKPEDSITGYFTSKQSIERNSQDPELLVREAFLRASREALNCWAVDDLSIKEIRGMLGLLEQFDTLRKELE